MESKVITLFEDKPNVTLTTYTRAGKHPAIVVLPGGAYLGLAAHEGEPVAIEFMSHGFNAFVLHYSVGLEAAQYPNPLVEVSAAIVHIRRHAEEYGIDPGRVFVTGASAGGHLAGAIGVMWHEDYAKCCDDMAYGENRPDGVILTYPCVTTDAPYAHSCVENVRGILSVEEMSLEKRVTDKASPAFIWHSSKDECVPVIHSLLLAEAYAKNGIDFELRIYNEGCHGTSLGTYAVFDFYAGKNEMKSAAWSDDAARWALEKGNK